MSKPKKHHTIPRVYLEEFVETDGRLSVWSKRRGNVQRLLPKNALTRYHYYSQPENGVDNANQSLETGLFNELESQYPDLLVSLFNKSSKVDIDVLIPTLCLFRIRSPSFREAFEVGLAAFVDKHRQSISYDDLPKPPMGFENIWDHIDPHRSIHAMHHYLNRYLNIFDQLALRLVITPTGKTLLTSDNPLVWYEAGYGKSAPSIYPAQITEKTRLVFPISRTTAILGKLSRTNRFSLITAPTELSIPQLREMNEMQCACSWDEIIGTAKLPNISRKKYFSVGPIFEIDQYNPNNNQFNIKRSLLGPLSNKVKYERKD